MDNLFYKNRSYSSLFFIQLIAKIRHCEKAFSADEAILQRSLISECIKITSFLAITIPQQSLSMAT